MAKKTLVRDQDKFMLRLPDGMRDRIKAKADRAGMSMNEAIVWCLEQYFPEPMTLGERLDALSVMVAALKKGNDLETKVDDLIDEIEATLRDVADKRIDVSPAFRDKVRAVVEAIDQEELQRAQDSQNPFDHAGSDSDPPLFADDDSKA